MTRLALILTITIAIVSTPAIAVHAAQEATPTPQTQQVPERAAQRLEQIKERLALTPEQIEQVRPIWTEEARRLKAMRDKHNATAGGGNRRARMKLARELRDIQQDTDEQLEKVLSKDQMKELKKLRDEWREQLRERADKQ